MTSAKEKAAQLSTTDTTRRMVGIVTAYHGPTDYRGSWIGAKWADDYAGNTRAGHTVRMEYRDELDSGDNHYAAAQTLLIQSARDEHWRIVGRIDSSAGGYTFVLDYMADTSPQAATASESAPGPTNGVLA